MNIAPIRYTSGRIALANLTACIEGLERRRREGEGFDVLQALAMRLFLRGDLLGRIADHERADAIAQEAVACAPDTGTALLGRARLAERFHRFDEALALLEEAAEAGVSGVELDATRAALLQATGRFQHALAIRMRLLAGERGIHTLGALASLLADMGRWVAAESLYAEAIDADDGLSPLPCAQLLFEWGRGAMRLGHIERADEIFEQLGRILPEHVPGRGHRAEVALARGDLDLAASLVEPLLATSDDPEYLAVHAGVLGARGDYAAAAAAAQRAAHSYEILIARRPEAYADHGAEFFLGIGHRPLLALDLAARNRALRDTPRSRRLLAKAREAAAAYAQAAFEPMPLQAALC